MGSISITFFSKKKIGGKVMDLGGYYLSFNQPCCQEEKHESILRESFPLCPSAPPPSTPFFSPFCLSSSVWEGAAICVSPLCFYQDVQFVKYLPEKIAHCKTLCKHITNDFSLVFLWFFIQIQTHLICFVENLIN